MSPPRAKRRRVDGQESLTESGFETEGAAPLTKESQERNKSSLHYETEGTIQPVERNNRSSSHSLDRPITPPLRQKTCKVHRDAAELPLPDVALGASKASGTANADENVTTVRLGRFVRSPVSLTRIQDLSPSCNIDTLRLTDILGDPLIEQAWIFNYLHDIDFIVSALDSDVRATVQVKVVHGSWKREDAHRILLVQQAQKYSNVELITAHMPEMFGTHHTKAFFLIRHDDFAQIIIHTANMIRQDWANLTQAVWRSPLLPLAPKESPIDAAIGSGHRFKIDILNYLRFYGSRTRSLVQQLEQYDFSAVKAALVGSLPIKQTVDTTNSRAQTLWGWRGLKRILDNIPCKAKENDPGAPQIVCQISSIATLGPKEKWLSTFLRSLASAASYKDADGTTEPESSSKRVKTVQNNIFKLSAQHPPAALSNIGYHIVFPTADEVRRSLDGYSSGGSIHMKIQNAAQQQQLQYLRPILRHWASDSKDLSNSKDDSVGTGASVEKREALRCRAAPHIKTYIRFSNSKMNRIDWAMVTSANLSKQAWGEMEKNGTKGGEVRISSYELGVVVWPALFESEDSPHPAATQAKTEMDTDSAGRSSETAVMVPVFGKDAPEGQQSQGRTIVGFRMPYDLPLMPYSDEDMPWCATSTYSELDWRGVAWSGFTPQ